MVTSGFMIALLATLAALVVFSLIAVMVVSITAIREVSKSLERSTKIVESLSGHIAASKSDGALQLEISRMNHEQNMQALSSSAGSVQSRTERSRLAKQEAGIFDEDAFGFPL